MKANVNGTITSLKNGLAVVNGTITGLKKGMSVVNGVWTKIWEAVSNLWVEHPVDYYVTDSVMWSEYYTYNDTETYGEDQYTAFGVRKYDCSDYTVCEYPLYNLDTNRTDIDYYSENGEWCHQSGSMYQGFASSYKYRVSYSNDITTYTTLTNVQASNRLSVGTSYYQSRLSANGDKYFLPVSACSYKYGSVSSPYAYQISILIYELTDSGYVYSGVLDKVFYTAGTSSAYPTGGNYEVVVSNSGNTILINGYCNYSNSTSYRFTKVFQKSGTTYTNIHSSETKLSTTSALGTGCWISSDDKYLTYFSHSASTMGLYLIGNGSLTYICDFSATAGNAHYDHETETIELASGYYFYLYQLSETGVTYIGSLKHSQYVYDMSKSREYYLISWMGDVVNYLQVRKISRNATTGVATSTSIVADLNYDWMGDGDESLFSSHDISDARFVGM